MVSGFIEIAVYWGRNTGLVREGVELVNRLVNSTAGDYGSLDYGGSFIDVEEDRSEMYLGGR